MHSVRIRDSRKHPREEDSFEDNNRSRSSNRCSFCREIGHNKTGCPSLLQSQYNQPLSVISSSNDNALNKAVALLEGEEEAENNPAQSLEPIDTVTAHDDDASDADLDL